MYREFEYHDAKDIAHHYNLNLNRSDNIWCPGGSEVSPAKIRLHAKSLSLRGKRITQVHEEDEQFLSYFGGYVRGDSAVFKIAVVNLAVDEPFELFKTDANQALLMALEKGVEKVILSGSSDKALYSKWAENTIGMQRSGDSNMWVAGKNTIQNHLRSTLIS